MEKPIISILYNIHLIYILIIYFSILLISPFLVYFIFIKRKNFFRQKKKKNSASKQRSNQRNIDEKAFTFQVAKRHTRSLNFPTNSNLKPRFEKEREIGGGEGGNGNFSYNLTMSGKFERSQSGSTSLAA